MHQATVGSELFATSRTSWHHHQAPLVEAIRPLEPEQQEENRIVLSLRQADQGPGGPPP
jgi:ABC-type uncharacterized transport system involved in gliding motility auxiliary subunit